MSSAYFTLLSVSKPAISKNIELFKDEFDKRFSYKLPRERDEFKRRTNEFVISSYYKPFTSLKLFKLSLISFIPIIQWLPHYNWKENLLPDVIGGLTVGVMHVPQGIAYALLAKQEAVIGLYTSMFPSLIYMVFGTSRHNSIGTFAVVSLMTGLAVDRLTHVTDNLPTSIEVASALTILVGVIQFCLGVLRLSFITTYFSDQVVSGFTTGASCHVFISQLKDAFGLRGMPSRSGPGYLFLKLYDIAANFNRINWAAVVTSVISIAFLVIGKDHINPLVKRKFKTSIPLPFELILVVAGTMVSYLLDMNRIYNVRIVHHIPTGLPGVSWPRFSLMSDLIPNGLGISVVVLAVHISLAKMFAKKLNYEVDPGQEMYAMGLASIGSGFFPVMPSACSLGRTIVSVESGTRTQLSTVFSIILLISVIAYFGKLLETLPMCILSAIVIVALKGMLNKFKELRTLWPLSKIDFSIWIVSFLATMCIDVTEGLAISILFALFTTIIREQWPRWHLLGNVSGTSDFRDFEKYDDVYFFKGICMFRFDSPLLFTNVETNSHVVILIHQHVVVVNALLPRRTTACSFPTADTCGPEFCKYLSIIKSYIS
ncbi:unnamed protein product [Angiostrongylus costaricensis]|uniref:SLC26A/SulP transporter domain-containing protein n=1 Tax=Angiostrongylus costaricensis TaxID=334426 RepID=A0A3P7I9W1_ANGCS|nr:unnamed protein product [Angiostrongylus costaricensis]